MLSVPDARGTPLRHRPNLQLCDQHAYLPGDKRQNQRRVVRNPIYAPVRGHDLCLLGEYHRRRLAQSCGSQLACQLAVDLHYLKHLFPSKLN